MCRDDKGGWLTVEEAKQYTVVGTDYRGLPIIHRGKGRPSTSVINMMMLDPDHQDTPSGSHSYIFGSKS